MRIIREGVVIACNVCIANGLPWMGVAIGGSPRLSSYHNKRASTADQKNEYN